MAETANLVPAAIQVTRHALDVADSAAITALPQAIFAAHGGLDLLVNNAGVALGGTFEDVAADDFDWLFSINFQGVVRMTRAFLPLLKASDDARLVNVSSVFGLIAPPGQAAYCASKFAVRGFSECLRHELAGTSVGVSVVHPGGVATSIARNARGAGVGRRRRGGAAEEEFSGVPEDAARTGRRDHRRRDRAPAAEDHGRQRRQDRRARRADRAGRLLDFPRTQAELT